jgi:hypothetical protein
VATSLQDESRWEREIGRLQQVAAADLQRVLQEANEAAEREGRLLRYSSSANHKNTSRGCPVWQKVLCGVQCVPVQH